MIRKILLVVAASMLGTTACEDAGTEPRTEPVAHVEVSAPAPTVETRTTLQLSATTTGRGGTVLAGRTVTWTSSDTLLATVSPSGLVSARAAGLVTIRAASEGKAGQTVLTIVPEPVSWVQITPAGDIVQAPGTTLQLGIIARANDGTELSGRGAAWSTTDTAVAVVTPGGMLHARGAGSARIIATVEGKTAEASVIVPTLIDRIQVDSATLTVGAGDEEQVIAHARAHDGTVLNRAFTWTSSSPTVASVSQAGVVRGVGNGTALITVSSEGKSATVQVRVGTWNRRALVAVGDTALPSVAFRKTQTDASGAARTVRYSVSAGHLRTLGLSQRYDLTIEGFFVPTDSPPVPGAYRSTGTYTYDLVSGDLVLSPDGGLPSFRGRHLEDGSLVVTWRPETSAPAIEFRLAAP
jgi:hypothetical protein